MPEIMPGDQQNQIYTDLLKNAVPIRALAIEPHFTDLFGLAPTLPVAYVDARKRPDIRDLARVHKMEGNGHCVSRWAVFGMGNRIEFILELRFTEPVKCRFNLHIPAARELTRNWTWLYAADRLGVIGVTTVKPPADFRAAGVVFQLGGTSLSQLLDLLTEQNRGPN